MRIAILPILFLALPSSAAGPLTEPATLLPHLGLNGTQGLEFSFTTEVVRIRSSIGFKMLAKSQGTYFILRNGLSPTQTESIKDGDIIAVSGKTAPFPLQPDFIAAFAFKISIIGHVHPEAPINTTISEIVNGQQPFRLIQVTGIICDAFPDEIDHHWQHLVISSGHASLGISVPLSEISIAEAQSLIGAEVSATGISQPYSSGYRRIFGTKIELWSRNDIQVITPAPSDPFCAPSLSRMRHPLASEISPQSRHCAEGSVIAIWSGGHAVMKCPDGNLVNITFSETSSIPAYGDYIQAVGLPETDLYRINLKRAIWRKKARHSVFTNEVPVLTNVRDIFTDGKGHSEINPAFHGKAITLVGSVIDVPTAGSDKPIFHLKCDNDTMKVDASSSPKVLQNLSVGSTVQVSGTCIVKTDSWHPNEPIPRINEVLLALRTPADFRMLSMPPWWTPNRLMILVATLFAALLAILLWNIMLRRVAERKSRELVAEKLDNITSKLKVEERTRIAVELHDSIAQNLTGVSLEIDSAEQLANKNPAGMMQHLRIAARTLQSCRNELRNCLWDLRSRALEEQDLNEAIRRAIAPQISEVTLTIRFNVPRTKLTDDIAHVLMRIVRELAINAMRHGNAKNVWIAGSLDGDRLLFSVRDDGSGFDPDTRPGVLQGHFGLQGIHERVNQFNGTMEIASTPGHGAKITISLNIPAKEQT